MASSSSPPAAGARRRRRFSETPRASGLEEEEPTSIASSGRDSPSSRNSRAAAPANGHGVAAANGAAISTPRRSMHTMPFGILRTYSPAAAPAPSPSPSMQALTTDPGAQASAAPASMPPSGDAAAAKSRAPVTSPTSTTSNQGEASVSGSSRLNRWDQAPRCSSCTRSAGDRSTTCCGVFLCTACAANNACRCPRWEQGLGAQVPVVPRYVVPQDHLVARPLIPPRARWQLFYTQRSHSGTICHSFFNLEDAFYRRHTGVQVQLHEYDVVGQVWTRFQCWFLRVQGTGAAAPNEILGYFVFPPRNQQDLDFLLGRLDLYREQQGGGPGGANE